MAFRYSSSIRTGGVVPHIYLPYGLRFPFGYWVSLSTMSVRPISLHVQWAGILSVVPPSLPIWRSFVVQKCKINYNFTGIILTKTWIRNFISYMNMRTLSGRSSTDRTAAGSTLDRSRQASSPGVKQGIAGRMDMCGEEGVVLWVPVCIVQSYESSK